jgi:glycosyltransferase involved in cell wall biosynthesis
MRLIPRRDHPLRRALRAWGRRCVARLGLNHLPRLHRQEPTGPRGSSRPGDGHRIVFVSGEAETPGHAYRVARFAQAAAELGCLVDVVDVDDLTAAHAGGETRSPTLVVIWRARHNRRLEQAVAAWRQRGTRIVFDVDDLMVDPGLATADVIDGIRSMGLKPADIARHYAAIRRTLEFADECLAPTEPLAAALRACGKPAEVAVNGFDHDTYHASREAVLRRRAAGDDGLVRIGYASGSRTHQRDFAVAAEAVAAVLRERPECRLVLFQEPRRGTPLLDLHEFSAFAGLDDRIEWRPLVPLAQLPDELVRFDVNLAPLEVGNPFCEAKSELKYFEAALVDVPTIASPTEPFRTAIVPGETGLLATTSAEWESALLRLVDDRSLRQQLARNARHHVLHRHGPDGRRERFRRLLDRVTAAAPPSTDALRIHAADSPARLPVIPDTELVAHWGGGRLARAAVVIPLHNYAGLIGETLDSVAGQTLDGLELIVVDDCSTDDSLDMARDWLAAHADRFVSATLLRTVTNQGLALTRNAGFAAAEAPFVFPLDADNTLEPDCLRLLLERLEHSPASAAHPTLQHFGEATKRKPACAWDPARLRRGNYIDAMALIRKAAWAHAGGYVKGDFIGWEDYELWCRFVEHGFWSLAVPEAVAGYRVHHGSMLRATTEPAMQRVVDAIRAAHPWLTVRAA